MEAFSFEHDWSRWKKAGEDSKHLGFAVALADGTVWVLSVGPDTRLALIFAPCAGSC